MCGITLPKLVEVSYGKTSQHNKGVLTTSSPHFTEYRTNLKHARHGGFQTLDGEHRTDIWRPLDQPPGTTTGTDEDGDTRRRRRPKTETNEDGDGRRQRETMTETVEDRLTLRTSEVAAPVQLTTPQSDKWARYFSSHATRRLPSPWRMQQSLQSQVQSWNRPSRFVPELAFSKKLVMKRWQSHQVVPADLTKD